MHTANVLVAWATAVHDGLDEMAGELGLNSRELSALTLIAEHDGCLLEWLRIRIGLTQSGTVRLIDRLVARDLVRRDRSTGRGVPLRATVAGTALLDRWAGRRDEMVNALLAAVPEEHRGEVVAGMAATLLARRRPRAEADATCRRCTWAECGDDCPVDRSVTGEASRR